MFLTNAMKILTLALAILSAGDVIGDLANNCNPGKCLTGYYHKNGECKTLAMYAWALWGKMRP